MGRRKAMQVVDLFCGGGGESTGILQAADTHGFTVDLHAVNHWERAIETHAANHPSARHYCTGVDALDPCAVIPGGKVDLLWASPECTHHSTARGGRPCSDQSRASAWLILKWLQELYVERVIIENVPEFLGWGPLGAHGRPLASKKGELFRAFVSVLQSYGYRVDWRILNAADFGAATTRRRLFIQAVRGRKRICWPNPTHGEDTTYALPGMDLKPWVPARDVIDWSIPGTSIFGRKKPLAANTLKRIEVGIKRYWGEWAEPFLVILRGKSLTRDLDLPLPTVSTSGAHFGLVEPLMLHQMSPNRMRPVSEPLPSMTTRGAGAVVAPFLTAFHGGSPNRNRGVDEPVPTVPCSNMYGLIEPFVLATGHKGRTRDVDHPLSTVVTKAEHCLVEPLLLHQCSPGRTRRVSEPLPTVTTTGAHALIVPYYGSTEARLPDAPLPTVTCKDRFALVQGVPCQLDILFRMFLPHELAAAQSFPPDYWFAGTKADQVRQIGNAVPPVYAEALAGAGMEVA